MARGSNMPSLLFDSIKRQPSLWVSETYFATNFNYQEYHHDLGVGKGGVS